MNEKSENRKDGEAVSVGIGIGISEGSGGWLKRLLAHPFRFNIEADIGILWILLIIFLFISSLWK